MEWCERQRIPPLPSWIVLQDVTPVTARWEGLYRET
jgi:hypothetical protein